MRGATLEQLAAGIHGAVTREDAKRLAKLHGVSWQALLKRMKRKQARSMKARRAVEGAEVRHGG